MLITRFHTEYALRLEADYQRACAKLMSRAKEAKPQPTKSIPMPGNKGDITVELICKHLDLAGTKNDLKWSLLRVRNYTRFSIWLT
jgi:hypothetical protein